MKKAKNVILAGVILAGTIGVNNMSVYASDKQNFILDEYVVTATRTQNKIFEANANISVITRSDIDRMHYETVEDVLRTVTNVQILDYGMPGYNMSKVRINGSDSVLVLIDGVRATMTGTGQQFPFHIFSDLNSVERIEVLKGTAAVMYGSDAKGGVINIITKKATSPKTLISLAGGDFGKEDYKFSTEGKVGDLSYRVYGQKLLSGNYEDGAGVEWDAYENTENTGIMLKQEFAPGSDIIFNYMHNDTDFSLYDMLYKQDIDGYMKYKNMQITYNQAITDSLTNTFTYNNSKNEHRGFLNNQKTGKKSNFWNTHYKSKVITNTLTKVIGDAHTIIAGYEYSKSKNLNSVRKKNTNNKYVTVFPEITNKAFFLQDEWNINEKWKLTSGFRYDAPEGGWVELDSNIAKSFNLGYKFNIDTNMYIAYNDYFILPTMSQLYDTKYGNAELLPEEGKNYEVGFNHMIDDRTMLNIHYFERDSDQNIGFSTQSNTYVNDNEKAKGFDVQVDKQFDDSWTANIGYSHLSYENAKGTTDYGYLPKNLVTIGVNYKKDKWDVGIDGRGFLGRDGDKVKSDAWPSDHYWVFNIGVNYKANKNLKLFAVCNNVFDVEYAEQTNRIYSKVEDAWYGMPGRNFIFGAEYSF